MNDIHSFPKHTEVLVVGSGAAGLVAALSARASGARVQLIEAGEKFGGTTALGGGRVWIPANGTPQNAGDSADNALSYLRQVFDERYPHMIEAFVASAPDMRHFVEKHSPHRFVVCPNYPDYHQNLSGSTLGGRAFDVAPVAVSGLAAPAANVLTPPGYLPITHAEWEAWRYPENYDAALIERRRHDGVLTGGSGMIAALLDGAVRAGVEVTTGAELVDLLFDGDQVSGAVVRRGEETVTIAAGAVVLASGGFDADEELRRRYLPEALGASASAHTNTGIALRLGTEYELALDNLSEGWWMPMMTVPGDTLDGNHGYPRALIRERGVPHQIIVNSLGERFLDESLPYNECGKAIHRRADDGSLPNRVAWLVVDQAFRDAYALPGLGSDGDVPPQYVSANTVAELARSIGVPVEALERTVLRWNELCATGHDDDFGRGDNAYDRYYGDPRLGKHRNLGPISRPPYVATRIFSATIGSKGGPVTTTKGEATRVGGDTVPGLYAAGNAAAFWTGDGYPGPGATLAIGMTFGYRAGRAAASYARLTS